jgi:hypothetical protein
VFHLLRYEYVLTDDVNTECGHPSDFGISFVMAVLHLVDRISKF